MEQEGSSTRFVNSSGHAFAAGNDWGCFMSSPVRRPPVPVRCLGRFDVTLRRADPVDAELLRDPPITDPCPPVAGENPVPCPGAAVGNPGSAAGPGRGSLPSTTD